MVELIWDGKYDAEGRRVAPPRIALPFQTVETVNETAQERQAQFDLFATGRDPAWRNRLIWGDKKYVLPSLLPEFAGKVDLVYIDPPFDTGADFSFTAQIPDNPETDEDEGTSFTKQPSMLEVKAYRDTWGSGLDTYLKWFYETAVTLRDLLSDRGSIYVHLDWHVAHESKVVLDEVLAREHFRNDVVWKSAPSHGDAELMASVHNYIMLYSKSNDVLWNSEFQPYDEDYLAQHYQKVDRSTGRLFEDDNLTAYGLKGGGYEYVWKGVKKLWRCPEPTMRQHEANDRLYYTRNGIARYKRFLDEMPGMPLTDLWADIPRVNSQALERVGYDTQKPERLLSRIISASSNPGDLVLDCFAGSGTTAAVAEKLGRRWITADLGRFAIHTTRKRLLGIPDVKPFAVQNLGKYERQAWQVAEFGERDDIEARHGCASDFCTGE